MFKIWLRPCYKPYTTIQKFRVGKIKKKRSFLKLGVEVVLSVLVGILRHVFHGINGAETGPPIAGFMTCFFFFFFKAEVSFCSFTVSTSPVTFLLSLLYPLKAGWKTERPPPRLSQSFLYLTTMLSLWCFQCCWSCHP